MIRKKCKISNTVKYKLLHAHRDLGGMEIDTLSDLVGIEKIIILMKGLESNTKFGQIMTEAVHRMQHYTKSNVSPLEEPTWYIPRKHKRHVDAIIESMDGQK